MIDKEALYNDLLEGFIFREYADQYGALSYSREEAIKQYRNDPRFHNRIRSVVGDIMNLVDKHENHNAAKS